MHSFITHLFIMSCLLFPSLAAATTPMVAAGQSHSVALRSNGTVAAWGDNQHGQVGDGTTSMRLGPVIVPGLSGVVAVAAGDSHSLAVKSDGTVVAWGRNDFSQLGDGTSTDRPSPVTLPGLAGVVAVEAGTYHSVALKSDGTVLTWGFDMYGALGDGTSGTLRQRPGAVPGLTGVVAVSAGTDYTMALKSNGTVMAWGAINNSLSPLAVPGLTAVVSIASGGQHGAALKSDGTVWTWGNDGSVYMTTSPVAVPGLAGVVAISAGPYYTVAVKSDGTVVAWGLNGLGQLGNGTRTYNSEPSTVQVGVTGVSAVSAGSFHALALKSDGKLLAWGTNSSGQWGDGTSSMTLAPKATGFDLTSPYLNQFIAIGYQVPSNLTAGTGAPFVASATSGLEVSLTNATPETCTLSSSNVLTAVAAGVCTIVANQAGNAVYGQAPELRYSLSINRANQSIGELGFLPTALTVGSTSAASATASSGLAVSFSSDTPSICAVSGAAITGLSVGTCGIRAVQPGDAAYYQAAPVTRSLAVGKGGQSVIFGAPPTIVFGGTGTVSAVTNSGLAVSFSSLTPGVCTVSGSSVTGVAGGTCIVAADQAGSANYNAATQVTQNIAITRGSQSLVLKNTMKLTVGETRPLLAFASSGLTAALSSLTPGVCTVSGHDVSAVAAGTCTIAADQGGNSNYNPAAQLTLSIPAGSSFATPMLAARDNHTVALKSDGLVLAWGSYVLTLVGDSGSGYKYSPGPVIGLTGVVAVAAGDYHTVALKSDGTVVTWGTNSQGQLGDGTATSRLSPLAVPGLTGVVAVSAGSSHAVALKSDGTVVAWGANYWGQLGDGTTASRFVPVTVPGLSGVVSLAAGAGYTMAIRFDGTVVAWGYNTYGGLGLGDGNGNNRLSPVPVPGLAGVVAIAPSGDHTFALKSDGTLMAWGTNSSYQLGDGTATTHQSPVAVPGISGVAAIAGTDNTVVLKSDGTVLRWGRNDAGQVGDGSTIFRYSPVVVPGLAGVTAIAGGLNHSVALRSDGTVAAWGANYYGQLGDGTGRDRLSPVIVPGGLFASQTVTFGAAPNLVAGGTGRVSASASSGLAVSFSSTTPGVCTVSGDVVTGLNAGTCIIASSQAGNADYNAATQTQSITIGKANQTVVFAAAPTIVVGGTGTVSASASSGLAVSFSSATPDTCTVNGSTVTGLAMGTCTIAASQAGSAFYGAADPVTQTISIGKVSQTIGAVSFSPATILLGGTASVNAISTSALPLSFSSATPGICTVSGNTVTGTAAGTCTVYVNQPGNSVYSPAPQVTQSISVGKLSQTVSFGAAPTIGMGETGTVSVSASSGLAVSLASLTPTVCSVSGATITGLTTGTCSIAADQAGNATYSPAAQVTQSISVFPTASGKIVDFSTGSPLSTATVTLTGGATTQTNPGGYFSIKVPSGFYDISIAKPGYKSVTLRSVIVSATSGGVVKTGLVPTTSASLNFKAAPTLPATSIGDSFSQPLTITGGNGPYTFDLAYNLLPAGLVLDSVIGVISGHASASGSFTFGIGVTDSLGAYAEREFTISVSSPLSIATQSLPRGMVARSYYAAILPSGGAEPYTFSQFSGAFPIGLSLDPAKGILQGKITDNPGAYTFAIKAVDQDGRSAVQSYSLNVDPSLTLTTPVLNDAVVGAAYSRTLAASGGLAPYAFSVYAGELPAGLALDPATGVVSGTPRSAGSAPLTVTVTDSIGRFVQKAYTLRALNPLQIPTTTLPNGFVGAAYSELVRVTGGIAPYSFSTVDTLPTGLTLNNVTGIVSGLPTAGGLTNVAITVTDSTWPTPQSRNVSIGVRISSQLTITSTSIFPNARKGVAVTPVTLAARGGSTPYLWSVIANQNGDTSNLPQGMSLNPATGIVSGTPADWGDYTFTIRVTDAAGIPVTANKQFYLHVSDTLQVATGTVPTAAVGEPYSAVLSATGGLKNYSWIVKNGALPAGLSLDSVSGTVSGTPVSKIISTVTFEVADSDAPPQSAQKSLAFEVADTLTISETALPNGRKGEAYAANVRSLPSAPAFAWKLAGGTLPPGISLQQNAGIASLQGTATTPGSYTFTLEVTDDGSPAKTASRQFTVVIYGPLTVTTTALSNAQRGLPYNAALAASGGAAPYLWRVVSGSLPLGLVVNSATGAISGITNADIGFTASFTVRVTDGGTPAAYLERTFTIQAVDPMAISTTAIQGALQNSPFSAALAGHGGISPLTWSVAVGSLPAGVSVNGSTGVVSGTPTTCGSFPFTVELADSSPVPAKVQAGFTLVTICSATGPYSLAVTLAGTGTGSVNSSPSGIACTGGNCSAQFTNGTTVTLLQSPSGSSRFGGWSGACTGTGSCSVSMTGTRAVTATFSKVPVNMIGTTGYDSLGQAYAAAPLGFSTTITALDGTLIESLQMNSKKTIVLKGGYNADYQSRSGEPTVLQGALKISSGKLTVDRVGLRKP